MQIESALQRKVHLHRGRKLMSTDQLLPPSHVAPHPHVRLAIYSPPLQRFVTFKSHTTVTSPTPLSLSSHLHSFNSRGSRCKHPPGLESHCSLIAVSLQSSELCYNSFCSCRW